MEDEDNNAWNDEAAAQRIAYRDGHSPVDDVSDDEANDDAILQGLEKNAEFKDGSAVRQLLAKDRKMKNTVLRERRSIGISLWNVRQSSSAGHSRHEEMLVDSLPPVGLDQATLDQNPVLALLDRSVSQTGMSLLPITIFL